MRDFDRDLVISYFLRTGVLVSIFLIFFGIILLFLKGGSEGYSLSEIASYHSVLNSSLIPLARIPSGIRSLDGLYFIALGLWVLIFTPITVVVISLISFVIRSNWLYVVLSGVVLFNLFFSMLIIPIILQ